MSRIVVFNSNRLTSVAAALLGVVVSLGTVGCASSAPLKTDPVAFNPDGSITVSDPPLPEAAAAANRVVASAVRAHVQARLVTEPFVLADFSQLSMAQTQELVDRSARAWEFAAQAAELAGEATELADGILSASPAPVGGYLGLPVAGLPLDQDQDAKTWAENFTKQFDAVKGNKKLQTLAKELGTDAKTVHQQLEAAQEIIRTGAVADAAFWDKMTKGAMAVKTGAKVGLLVVGTVATGGGTLGALATSSLTATQAAVVTVQGVDAIIDVYATGSTIMLGENHQTTVALNDVKKWIEPVSSVLGLATLPSGGAEEKIGYLGDSLAEWFAEGKIMGIKVTDDQLGATTRTISQIPYGEDAVETAEKLRQVGIDMWKDPVTTLEDLVKEYTMDQPATLEAMKAEVSNLRAGTPGLRPSASTQPSASTEPEAEPPTQTPSEPGEEPTQEEPTPVMVDVSGTYDVTGTYGLKWSGSKKPDTDKMTPFEATVTQNQDSMSVVLRLKSGKLTLKGSFDPANGKFSGQAKPRSSDPMKATIWEKAPTTITFKAGRTPITAVGITRTPECKDCVVQYEQARLEFTRIGD